MNTERVARYAVIAIGLALAVVMLAVLTRSSGSQPDISSRVVSVAVGDPRSISVTFEVDKAPQAAALCSIAAFADSGKSAGRLSNVVVPARDDGSRITQQTVIVPTVERAVRAGIATCAITRTR